MNQTNPDDYLFRANGASGKRLWQDKYRFRRDMLPAFVGEAFGKRVCYH
jgi:gamma-tubulin complex component 3